MLPDPLLGERQILCHCNKVSVQAFLGSVEAAGNNGFEHVLELANVGNRCTACLLDAEHFFLNSTKYGRSTVEPGTANITEAIPFRRRLWKFLDRWSPVSPYPLGEFSPVLRGPHLETSICIANDRFMHRDDLAAPPLELKWAVYDGAGKKLHAATTRVECGEAIKIPASSWLPQEPGSGLTIGSVYVRRRFLQPGVRGTTRPQILLEAANACCAVHVQGANGRGSREFNMLSRSDSERMFVTCINADSRALTFRGVADVLDGEDLRREWDSGDVVVPPRNARIFEVKTGNSADASGAPRQAFLKWNSSGIHKAHIICSDKSLTRFSIDHP